MSMINHTKLQSCHCEERSELSSNQYHATWSVHSVPQDIGTENVAEQPQIDTPEDVAEAGENSGCPQNDGKRFWRGIQSPSA